MPRAAGGPSQCGPGRGGSSRDVDSTKSFYHGGWKREGRGAGDGSGSLIFAFPGVGIPAAAAAKAAAKAAQFGKSCCFVPQSCPALCRPTAAARQASLSWDFPTNTGGGCHFLLQWIFSTQGLKSHLLHWQMDSLPLSHLGSPLPILPPSLIPEHCSLISLLWSLTAPLSNVISPSCHILGLGLPQRSRPIQAL